MIFSYFYYVNFFFQIQFNSILFAIKVLRFLSCY